MNTLTSVLAILLRQLARVLASSRREWVEAVEADADQVPVGRARLAWLLGGVWLVLRDARLIRRIAYAAALAAVGTAGFLLMRPDPANSALAVAIVATMAVLPLLGRWRPAFGPVRPGRATRAIRFAGYTAIAAVLLLLLGAARYGRARFSPDPSQAAEQAWQAEQLRGAIIGGVVIFALFAAYAGGVLAVTAQRSRVTPVALKFGTAAGVAGGAVICALTPLGHLLPVGHGLRVVNIVALLIGPGVLMALAGILTARRIPEPADPAPAQRIVGARPTRGDHTPYPVGQAIAAGMCTGATAALLAAAFGIATILLFPHRVPVEWANPDRNAVHGTAYEVRMTISDTADRYLMLLLFAPLAGAAVAAVAASGVEGRPVRREEPELSTMDPDRAASASSSRGSASLPPAR